MTCPKDLNDFCNMGTLCSPGDCFRDLWKRSWNKGKIGIRRRHVVRDLPPIEHSPPIPSHCWVMKRFHPEEFHSFEVSKVFVRDCFFRLTDTIIALYLGDSAKSATTAREVFTNPFMGFKTTRRQRVIVTGSPGNGKTMFLHFLLRCRLQAKLPTILQLDPRSFFLFSEFGVHEFTESPFSSERASVLSTIAPDLWCLSDSNDENIAPSNFLQSSGLSIIQTASPRQQRFDWTKKSNLKVQTYFMPPFSLEEAIIARSLQIEAPSELQLQEWFDDYAPSARLAYRYAATVRTYERLNLPQLLKNIEDPISVSSLTNKAMSFTADDLSHEIFTFFPSDDFEDFTCRIPTRYLVKKVMESCNLQNDERRKTCFRLFLPVPHLAAPAGYLMELLVHALLPSGGSWQLLTLSVRNHRVNQYWAVDRSKNDRWLVIDPKQQPALHISSVPPASNALCHDPQGLKVRRYDTLEPSDLTDHSYYIPNSSNQATFDSFYYLAGHVYMFQCTVTGEGHKVVGNGLHMMHELGVKKVTYIAVVPTDREPSFIINKSIANDYKKLLCERYLLQLDPNSF